MEFVYAVPRRKLFKDYPAPHGFIPMPEASEKGYIRNALEHGLFVQRSKVEEDPSFKQIIPYCLVRNHEGAYFFAQRQSKGGEKRLHGKYSIGIGGHINPMDEYEIHDSLLRRCAVRELDEELVFENDPRNIWYTRGRIVGVINDDSDEVGSVHFGVVFLFELLEEFPHVDVHDREELTGYFAFPWITALPEEVEGWTQHLLQYMRTFEGKAFEKSTEESVGSGTGET